METFELENNVSQTLPRASAAATGSVSSAGINVDSLKAVENHSVDTTMLENKEWTIEIKRDSQRGKPSFEATLVFIVTTQNGIVTGQVWEGVDSHLLSTVTGTYTPLPGGHRWSMALEFKWGDVNVTLSGEAVETPATVLFTGRYSTRALTTPKDTGEMLDPLPTAPGDGDTGTGTGQQT